MNSDILSRIQERKLSKIITSLIITYLLIPWNPRLNIVLGNDFNNVNILNNNDNVNAKAKPEDTAQLNDYEHIVAQEYENKSAQATAPQDRQRSRNYASAECAKVVETNPEAKKSWLIISESNDEYMLNPCKAKIWFVIELCEKIQATHIEIANYELFSSTPKDFTVFFSDIYPTTDWKTVGQFSAADTRSLQTFDLSQVGFGKYIRVELHSHHRNEQYCPISQVKIYGISMVEDYDMTENNDQNKINTSQNDTTAKKPRPKRKTSSYRVYMNMLMTPYICGLTGQSSFPNDKPSSKSRTSGLTQNDVKNGDVNQLQPFVPNQNRTVAPLKPSIFVELSNKYKKLELSIVELKTLNEDMERRLNETELKLERSTSFLNNNFQFLVIVVKAFLVYKFMLNLM